MAKQTSVAFERLRLRRFYTETIDYEGEALQRTSTMLAPPNLSCTAPNGIEKV
jgi:hypothetical protein